MPQTFATMTGAYVKLIQEMIDYGLIVEPKHILILIETVRAQKIEIARLENALRGAKDDASRLRYPDTTGR